MVWVGKIAPGVDEKNVKRLLEACGEVKAWKPVLDIASGKHKGFGFCTFETANGAVTALHVLNNLKVGGQELLLKPNKATEAYLNWHKAQQQEHATDKLLPRDDGVALGRVKEILESQVFAAAAITATAAEATAPDAKGVQDTPSVDVGAKIGKDTSGCVRWHDRYT